MASTSVDVNRTYKNIKGTIRRYNNIAKAAETWKQRQRIVNAMFGKQTKKKWDICVKKPDICKGHLGIHRHLMPQIKKKEIPELKQALNELGITYVETKRNPSELHATQDEMDKKKIKEIKSKIMNKSKQPVLGPIIISQEGAIIDGHHRWAAWKKTHPETPLNVVQIDLPINEALAIITGALGASTAYTGPTPSLYN